jgi:hypothetical protein
MKAFQEIEVELTRLRMLEPQLLKRITELERENKELRKAGCYLIAQIDKMDKTIESLSF